MRKTLSYLLSFMQYKPRSDGLEELLRRRKNFVEGSGTLDELMSPEGDSSYSASETQKSGESKDDQGIHVHCAPTPPPKSRERIVYTWSKDGTVLPRSKGQLITTTSFFVRSFSSTGNGTWESSIRRIQSARRTKAKKNLPWSSKEKHLKQPCGSIYEF